MCVDVVLDSVRTQVAEGEAEQDRTHHAREELGKVEMGDVVLDALVWDCREREKEITRAGANANARTNRFYQRGRRRLRVR